MLAKCLLALIINNFGYHVQVQTDSWVFIPCTELHNVLEYSYYVIIKYFTYFIIMLNMLKRKTYKQLKLQQIWEE